MFSFLFYRFRLVVAHVAGWFIDFVGTFPSQCQVFGWLACAVCLAPYKQAVPTSHVPQIKHSCLVSRPRTKFLAAAAHVMSSLGSALARECQATRE